MFDGCHLPALLGSQQCIKQHMQKIAALMDTVADDIDV